MLDITTTNSRRRKRSAATKSSSSTKNRTALLLIFGMASVIFYDDLLSLDDTLSSFYNDYDYAADDREGTIEDREDIVQDNRDEGRRGLRGPQISNAQLRKSIHQQTLNPLHQQANHAAHIVQQIANTNSQLRDGSKEKAMYDYYTGNEWHTNQQVQQRQQQQQPQQLGRDLYNTDEHTIYHPSASHPSLASTAKMDPQSSTTTNNKQIRYQDVGQQGYDYYTNDVWHLKQQGDTEEELITKKENTRWLKSIDQLHQDEALSEFDYHLQSEWTRPTEDEPQPPVEIERHTLLDVIKSQDWSSGSQEGIMGEGGSDGGSQEETAIVMYNPITDTFIGLSKPSSFSNLSTNNKLDHVSMRNSDLVSTEDEGTSSQQQNELWNSMRNLVIMLRATFPMRFQGVDSDELILVIKTGHQSTLGEGLAEGREGDHNSDLSNMITQSTEVPVLMFGSTLRQHSAISQQHIIPMPSSGLHLGCFREWSLHHTVCDKILHPGTGNGNGERRGDNWWTKNKEWDTLIPQVVWRGLDTDYLPTSTHTTMKTRPQNIDHVEELVVEPAVMKRRKRRLHHGHKGVRKEERVETVHDLVESHTTERYTRALSSIKEQLLPRWKGAVLSAVSCLYLSPDCLHLLDLTLQKLTNSLPQHISSSQEAELEVQQGQRDGLPWANIKFSRHLGTDKLPSDLSSDSQDEEDATARPANIMEYKYQLDLAGSSGTAASDTLDKLAMPGVLFHHVTPTQDYIHAHLTAWKHYIPIQEDLSDLKEKFYWAESHQDQAKKIALEGIEFMKQLGTPQGFGRIYEQDFVRPLRRVVDAYQPVSSLGRTYGGKGSAVVDVLAQLESSGYVPIIGCSGRSDTPDSCQPI